MASAFRHELGQRAEQRMLLEPRLLMAIEVLALPAVELVQWLRAAYERNEALVLEDPPRQESTRTGDSDATARHSQWLESLPAAEAGARAYVLLQISDSDVSAAERAWLEFLVACLDDDGLLSEEDGALLQLAASLGLSGGARELGRAIAELQALDPRGVGARDRREALMLQLDPSEPDYALLCTLIEEHLEDIERNRLPQVARALGTDLEQLALWVAALTRLRARPFASLAGTSAPVVAPDLVVEWDGDTWHLDSVRGLLPTVRLDPKVAALATDRDQSASVRRHLRSRVREVEWILESMERRDATLLRVAAAALAHQPRFFERGPAGLAPLTMTEIADELQLHVSTVSRAVSGKSVQTPFGILPLRELFPQPAADGARASRGEAGDIVRELVAAEDPTAPLSDLDLVAALAKRGIRVARRTVAKHRDALGIPSSYRRRRHA